VRCADLARVTELTCPVRPDPDRPLPDLWFPNHLVEADPDPAATPGALPVHTVLVPTDGSRAAVERVRTLAALAAPYSLARTADDVDAAAADRTTSGLDTTLRLATVFVLLVAACSLTVSVASGLMERRRAFALLRASGTGIGELRRVALLETGVPLTVTVFGAFGVAMLVIYAVVPGAEMVLPSAGFFATIGAGVLAAVAITLITWPLMNAATGHDSVRFE
jgi:predicted lysophospholipase L1 biosynthesis ABC-type transport system permease subunit